MICTAVCEKITPRVSIYFGFYDLYPKNEQFGYIQEKDSPIELYRAIERFDSPWSILYNPAQTTEMGIFGTFGIGF